MTTSLFEVHFTRIDQYIEEVQLDATAEKILDGIVRLALVSGAAPGRSPSDVAQSWYAESSYVSTRQQLVKISLFAGWKWTRPQAARGAGVPDERQGHNNAVDLTVRETFLRLQAPLQKVEGIHLRGGSLVEAHDIWTPEPEMEITAPEPLKCATCAQAIYYANEQWRHQASGQAEVYESPTPLCPTCLGSAGAMVGGRLRNCQDCRASPGVRITLNHLADPKVGGRKV